MKGVIGTGFPRDVKCLQDIDKFKKGSAYKVYIQYMRDTGGVAVFPYSIMEDGYAVFETPTELLQYFDTSLEVADNLERLEQNGYTAKPDTI